MNPFSLLNRPLAWSVTPARLFLGGIVLLSASPLTCERYTRNWQGATAGWSWDPQLAPRFKLAQELPLKNLYAVGHYVFNPGGVPTAMITAWYIAREILEKAKRQC